MNIMIVFLVSGLWHGAAWTFVVFGLLHGIYLVTPLIFSRLWCWIAELQIVKKFPNIYQAINIILAFSLFGFSLVFFRALSINDAFEIVVKSISERGPVYIGDNSTFVYGLFFIILLLFIELEQEFNFTKLSLFNNRNYIVRNLSYAAMVIIILLFGVFDGGQFVYFQF